VDFFSTHPKTSLSLCLRVSVVNDFQEKTE